MKKNVYNLRIYSKTKQDINKIESILIDTQFADILFPSTIYLNPENPENYPIPEIHLFKAKEFMIKHIPSEFINSEKLFFPMSQDNGMEFWINWNLDNSSTINSMVLEFSKEHLLGTTLIERGKIIQLITECKNILEISKAEVVFNSTIVRKSKWIIQYSAYQSEIVYPQWITYLGKEIGDFVGRNHLLSLDGCAEIREVGDGILFVFQEEPFDPENPEHINHRDYILEQLNAIPLPPPKD